jgi:DNA-directed RNA polymerase subunit N (RpoN/RPB10)
MSLITTSRPVYEVCSTRSCGRDLLYQDYINVLAEAGVDKERLRKDLFLDEANCCTREILNNAPESDDEYVDRLARLKSITLIDPPSFYAIPPGEEARPMYEMDSKRLMKTNEFIGAEPYYYLVERGENPLTILTHLRIDDSRDVLAIMAATDRPATDFECQSCGESIPHYKYASHVYKKGSPSTILEAPDRVIRPCCVETLLSVKLTEEEKKDAELLLNRAKQRFAGIPVDRVPINACISCGNQDTKYSTDYEWLVHKGVPSVVALNYFGLNRLCCRQATMNPIIKPRSSKAVIERKTKQMAAIPPEIVTKYDYSAARIAPLSGEL